MNKFKLIALLTIAMPCMIHTAEQTIEPETIQAEIDTTSHQLSQFQRFILNTITQIRSFNQSGDLTGNLQTLTNNRIKIILQKMGVQQIELLVALSKNNDQLIQSLNSSTDPQTSRSLLLMSKEILSLITALSSYTTQAKTQINQS